MDVATMVAHIAFYAEQLTDVVQLLISLFVLFLLLRVYQLSTQLVAEKKKKDQQ